MTLARPRLAFALALSCGCATASPAPAPLPAVADSVPTPPPPDARARLRALADSLVTLPGFRSAHWGILIVDPVSAETLYSHNAGKLFAPASNQKLITGAVALAQLGPDHRFRTIVAKRGRLRDGTLRGDLVLVGRGDPSLSDRVHGDARLPLRAMADSLAARGIRRIVGQIFAEGDAFPDAWYGHGWPWDDFDWPYSAPVDELYLNEGFLHIEVRGGARAGARVRVSTTPSHAWPRVRVEATTVEGDSVRSPEGSGTRDTVNVSYERGPTDVAAGWDERAGEYVVRGTVGAGDAVTLDVAQRDPARTFIAAFGEVLSDAGIRVTPPSHRRPVTRRRSARPRADSVAHDSLPPLDTLVVWSSPTLAELLPKFEKPSQNQIGEILLKTLGLERGSAGTAREGRRVIAEQLLAWGALRDGFDVHDGSGLSLRDRVSPETLVLVLDTMRLHPHFRLFHDALPIAGVDGTIRTRMRGTAAQGNVRAKTGTLSSARSLSGYVTTADGRLLLFSMLCNNYLIPLAQVTAVQDTLATYLAGARFEEVRVLGP